MKRNLMVLSIAVCSTLLFASAGCKKNHAVDCSSASKTITDAAQKYFTTQTKENCAAYKAALQSFIDDCGSGANAADKEIFQAQLSSLACQ